MFVVIGRNEGARLERCLASVLSHCDRVVYADSASTDGSPELAKKMGAKVIILSDDGRLSAARGRNAGYAELIAHFPDCETIQFLDGDCILQNGWLDRAIPFLNEHPQVAVVCGRRFEAHPHDSIYNAQCDQEWNTNVGEAKECGGDSLVRRSAFDQVGGFCSELRAGEEPEMASRMRAAGWRIWRLDEPMTEHDAQIHLFSQWWRRTMRTGYGFAQVWDATSVAPERLYGRNVRSALVWAVAIPAVIALSALFAMQPLLLLLWPAAYAFQIMRMKVRGDQSWTGAALVQIAKIPEAIGALRYFLSGSRAGQIQYKVVS